MSSHPIDTFLIDWAASRGDDDANLRLRVYKALSLSGRWDRIRLKVTLRSLLVLRPEDRRAFDARFDAFFFEEEIPRWLSERMAGAPVDGTQWDASQILAVLCNAQQDPISPTAQPTVGMPREEPAGSNLESSSIELGPAQSQPVAQSTDIPIETIAQTEEDGAWLAELPADLDYRSPEGPQPLSSQELDLLAYQTGLMPELTNIILDLRATVHATIRQGGLLEPVYQPIRRVGHLWVVLPGILDPVSDAIVDSLVTGLRNRGVPVGISFDIHAIEQSDMTLVVVDLSQQQDLLRSQVQSSASVAFVEARDPGLWGREIERLTAPVFSLDFPGLLAALKAAAGNWQPVRPQATPLRGHRARLAEVLPLAAACALAAPCDLGIADQLRRRFTAHLPFSVFQRILQFDGVTADISGWRFSLPLQRWLSERVGREFRLAILRWQVGRLKGIPVTTGTRPASVRERELALVHLQIAVIEAEEGGELCESELSPWLAILECQQRDGSLRRRLGERTADLSRLLPQAQIASPEIRPRLVSLGFQFASSAEELERIQALKELEDAYWQEAQIPGTPAKRIKGGLEVHLQGGIVAFLPGSQIDLRPVRDLDAFLGKNYLFKIIKFNKKRGNIVLSRRIILEKERAELKEQTREKLKVGQIVEGVIKNITDYGAFVDIGGIDGLIHITDMSWGRINHPSELLKVGDHIQAKVIKYIAEAERISLGIRQLTADPWLDAIDRYAPGTVIMGHVVSIKDYGAFIEIEPGIEGLLHISEMSWLRNFKHPSKLLAVRDKVEAVVLDIDVKNKRISLGMKQLTPNPYEQLPSKYPVGTIVRGRVRNIADFGIYLEIEDGIDGLVHISNLAWGQHTKNPFEFYSKGDEVDAVVLQIDTDSAPAKISLGIKQLTADPWDWIPGKYHEGKVVSVIVRKVTDYGIFAELEHGVIGVISISEFVNKLPENPSSIPIVGQEISAQIVRINPYEGRIDLSVSRTQRSPEAAANSATVPAKAPPSPTPFNAIRIGKRK